MTTFDPLSPEVAYALKGNIVLPTVGASGSANSTKAATRIIDAYTESNAAQTQHVTAVTVAATPVANQ